MSPSAPSARGPGGKAAAREARHPGFSYAIVPAPTPASARCDRGAHEQQREHISPESEPRVRCGGGSTLTRSLPQPCSPGAHARPLASACRRAASASSGSVPVSARLGPPLQHRSWGLPWVPQRSACPSVTLHCNKVG